MKKKPFIAVALAGFMALLFTGVSPAAAACPAGTVPAVPGSEKCVLDPAGIPKYETDLVIPPVMPFSDKNVRGRRTVERYEIAVRQFDQQILPAPLPKTTVWSYGSVDHPGTVTEGGSFFYPALTIEARWRSPVVIEWINDLRDPETNECLPHLLPVDPALHWANPIGPRDARGPRDPEDPYWDNPNLDDRKAYTGPVPIVTHVHGAETNQESDGYPEAWWLPDCNVPEGINWRTGTLYDEFEMTSAYGDLWKPGSAVFSYPNDQRATTLWYHDHALGMTRLNVYAGPAGFYLLRGGPDDAVRGKLPGPAPRRGDKLGGRFLEIPIVIQDRTFNPDGSLFYPDNRAFFEGLPPQDIDADFPFIPAGTLNPAPYNLSDVAPIWNPEFFGNTLVVNGRTWPNLAVEQRRYRLRFLNGSQSRFLILEHDNGLPFWQIGADGGFLPEPVELDRLLLGPAERADVIVDFSGVPAGTEIVLLNLGPDEPFGGGEPGADFPPADPQTTGQVMRFVVEAAKGPDTSTPPERLVLPYRTPLPQATVTRHISLNEEESHSVCVLADEEGEFIVPIEEVACDFVPEDDGLQVVPFGPTAALLGTVDFNGLPEGNALLWGADITENPLEGSSEIWKIWNFTEDAHPIHVHLVQFEILGREVIGDPGATSVAGSNGPLSWEKGTKDTVIVYPGETATIRAHFTMAGLYVWHCHILEHEDNEMMRPYCVRYWDGTSPDACEVADDGGMM